ncbi:hypothetical protein Tasa_010_258 [Tanticharoenia sakaeratensis NBRC 103193]|uniref:Uncharacterized protein n=1 Tax=Tanticharoenia sakaeratensis NBRC 103193 TaxID=1231623 RepID=A0A0D6MJQ1_9PROT|nr:hypothetical protein Tasa_010_258 [Tanticharoenia sakaeratensis NBRC 103193]GBQ17120.1 hypothetical protein AA103193_0228 [Tanticharoenia sakaeratensis NBRC 103193]
MWKPTVNANCIRARWYAVRKDMELCRSEVREDRAVHTFRQAATAEQTDAADRIPD